VSTLLRRDLLTSTRARLIAVLAVATLAISVLAVQAAGSSLSYYVTPEEFAEQVDPEGGRWRVGGRIVDGSVVERNGRPVAFTIEGDSGETMQIAYDGVVPGLFAARAFVVVEGVSDGPGSLLATTVIVRHEPEFVTDPDDAAIAAP
jgi:cytochrome c-type biogenesis protein CcmE